MKRINSPAQVFLTGEFSVIEEIVAGFTKALGHREELFGKRQQAVAGYPETDNLSFITRTKKFLVMVIINCCYYLSHRGAFRCRPDEHQVRIKV